MQNNRLAARCSKLAAIALAVACLAELEAAPARNFIWKAAGKQGVVYLVGSVHLLTKDFYPLSPALEAAYKSSDLLVEEVDMGDMLEPGAQMQLLSRGLLSGDQSLDKVLSPATFALLSKKLAEVGAPVEALKRMKPWMIALTLEAMQWQKAGFDADLGLDKHFYDQAKQEGKEVQGLETIDYQISRFDEMPMHLQDHLLAETIKGIDTEQSNMTKLIEAWRAGDAAAGASALSAPPRRAEQELAAEARGALLPQASSLRRCRRCAPRRTRRTHPDVEGEGLHRRTTVSMGAGGTLRTGSTLRS
jgi:uncharacterized protein YbaP (TraB family)